MNCKISDDDQYNDIPVSLNNQAIKAFQIVVMRHLEDVELKIQRNQKKNFQQKIIPFYLKYFVNYINKNESQTDITKIKSLFKNNQFNTNSLEVLIKIFQEKQYKYLQEKWIDYMEGQALVDVIQNIKSKKIRIIYLQALDILQSEISKFKIPYFFLFKIYNDEKEKLLFKCEYEMKTDYELLVNMQTKRKMIICRKQGK